VTETGCGKQGCWRKTEEWKTSDATVLLRYAAPDSQSFTESKHFLIIQHEERREQILQQANRQWQKHRLKTQQWRTIERSVSSSCLKCTGHKTVHLNSPVEHTVTLPHPFLLCFW